MSTIIYHAAHQDDETLFLGVAITKDIYDGHDVHIVDYSTGENSNARNVINGTTGTCSWHGFTHDPTDEGYTTLTTTTFSEARIREFRQAAARLGVTCSNIHAENSIADNSFTIANVQAIMGDYITAYPGAIHKAQSYTDSDNADHRAVGDALLAYVNDSTIDEANAFFYIRFEDLASVTGTVVTEAPDSVTRYKDVRDNVYKFWQPTYTTPHYGVGYHSVKTLFDSIGDSPVSKYHLPNDPPT